MSHTITDREIPPEYTSPCHHLPVRTPKSLTKQWKLISNWPWNTPPLTPAMMVPWYSRHPISQVPTSHGSWITRNTCCDCHEAFDSPEVIPASDCKSVPRSAKQTQIVNFSGMTSYELCTGILLYCIALIGANIQLQSLDFLRLTVTMLMYTVQQAS